MLWRVFYTILDCNTHRPRSVTSPFKFQAMNNISESFLVTAKLIYFIMVLKLWTWKCSYKVIYIRVIPWNICKVLLEFTIHKRYLAPIDGRVYTLKMGSNITGWYQAGTAYSEFAWNCFSEFFFILCLFITFGQLIGECLWDLRRKFIKIPYEI